MRSSYLLSLSEVLSNVGQRVQRLRLARNQTQRELALAAGVGLKALRRFEATGHGTMETGLRVAVALSVAEPFEHLFAPEVRSLADVEALDAAATRKRARKRRS